MKVIECPNCGTKLLISRDGKVIDSEPRVESDEPPVLWRDSYFGPGFQREPALEGDSR